MENATLESPINPHILWRQLLGFILFTVVVTYVAGGIAAVVMGLALGGTTFADAWISGIYKDPEKRTFLNISPMGWGIVTSLLFIVGYPAYVINRNKLRTINAGDGFFYAMVVIGGLVAVWLIVGLTGLGSVKVA